MHPIIVQDIMTSPVFSVCMDETVEDIRSAFEENRFHHIVVKGDGGECFGVISDRDLLKNLSPYLGKFSERASDTVCLKRRAHQIMTRSLVTVRPMTHLRAAARLMLDNRFSCMPVVDANNVCIGIITINDIMRWAVGEMEDGSSESRAA